MKFEIEVKKKQTDPYYLVTIKNKYYNKYRISRRKTMNVYYRLKYLENITGTEELIKDYILQNMKKTSQLSQDELAKEVHCSSSAISRFVKKLSFSHYKEFQIQLIKDLSEDLHKEAAIDYNFPFHKNNTQFEISKNIADLYHDAITHTLSLIDIDQLHHTVRMLYHAKFIDLYAVTNNVQLALNFQDKMQTIGRYVNVSIISQTQRYMALASDKNHVAIIISYSGKTPEMIKVAQILKKQNTPFIYIGSPQDSIIKRLSTHQLYVTDREHMSVKISYFASHIATQYVLDCLFGCLFKIDFEDNMDYHLNSYNLLDPRNQ